MPKLTFWLLVPWSYQSVFPLPQGEVMPLGVV